MARNVNAVTITGNLTKAPELRTIPSGTQVCDLRVAVNDSEKKGDEWVDRANFFSVTVWGNQGAACDQYLDKGSPVAISGRLRFEEWEKDGEKRSAVKIVARDVQFLPSKKQEEQG